MIKSPYIERLETRLFTNRMKRQIVLGLVIGWVLMLVSAYQYYFVEFANDTLWLWLMYTSMLLLALAVIFPAFFALPEKLINKVGNFIFRIILGVILSILYALFFIPIGLIIRRRKRPELLTSWLEQKGEMKTGWSEKIVFDEDEKGVFGQGRRSLWLAPFRVINYFSRQGHALLIPLLVLLIFLGFIMIFLQTSAIAPMIYTLF